MVFYAAVAPRGQSLSLTVWAGVHRQKNVNFSLPVTLRISTRAVSQNPCCCFPGVSWHCKNELARRQPPRSPFLLGAGPRVTLLLGALSEALLRGRTPSIQRPLTSQGLAESSFPTIPVTPFICYHKLYIGRTPWISDVKIYFWIYGSNLKYSVGLNCNILLAY